MPKRNARNNRTKKPRPSRAEQTLTSLPLTHRAFRFLPDNFRVRLTYTNEETISNGASATAAQNFKLNSLYDLDNTFGSTATPAATALGTIWTRSTILGGHITVRAQNRETYANGVGFVITNTNPGTSGSGLYIKAGDRSSTFRRGLFRLVSPVATGGSMTVMSLPYSTCQIAGSTRPLTDDNFSALIGVDPTDLVWFSLFIDSGSASVQTNGIKFSIELMIDVVFTQRASLSV